MKSQRVMTNRGPGVSPDFTLPGIFTGCWKLELATKMLTICPHAHKMLGFSVNQEIKLSGFFKLLEPEHVKHLVREFKFACASDTKFEVQVKVNTPNGKIKWFCIVGVQVYRQWGAAEQMAGVIEDTTQLVNEECLSLAVVNHELRSPLTVIKLNVQLLINMLKGSLDKHPLKMLNTVDFHIKSMTKLIGEYLTSPVRELRQGGLNRAVFDLDDLIDLMVCEMIMLHPGYCFIRQNKAKVCVRADKYKIVQVFTNYLTNAVNFSPPSSRITISCATTATCVEVAVCDQGIGIPSGQEENLFQKFYRCGSTSLRQKNSKGLGLYLVKKIITEHDGMVRAEKGRDGGSAFYFSLPVYQEDTPDTPGDATKIKKR
jgi:two-component system sensor histidine kinase VicK